jgi:uncharacterized RDD family membrane protein YckC
VAIDTNIEIETPEHIRFRHMVAGPARRGLAYLIDLLIRAAVLLLFGLWLMISGVALGSWAKTSQSLLFVALFLLEWGYFVLFESLWQGRTPGKRALSLRVIKLGGYPVTFVDSLLRNLVRAADFLPMGYAVGLTAMAADSRFRRLGDQLAGTLVVVEEKVVVAAPLKLDEDPARLAALPERIRLTGDEEEALALFLRRAPSLSAARQAELAQMIAPQLAGRLGVAFDDGALFLRLVYARAAGHRHKTIDA